jgi:Uma2 family endonuclease
VEILSPDQNWAQFLDKIQFYLLNGVRLIWVLDPTASTVTVEAPGEEARILRPGDTMDGGDVLPGFSYLVADIFAQVDR